MSDTRPLRVCDACGGVDSDPRHIFSLTTGTREVDPKITIKVIETAPPEAKERITREIMDTSTFRRHMDCCRSAGCPDGTCDEVTKGAEDLRGAELVAHLTRELESETS